MVATQKYQKGIPNPPPREDQPCQPKLILMLPRVARPQFLRILSPSPQSPAYLLPMKPQRELERLVVEMLQTLWILTIRYPILYQLHRLNLTSLTLLTKLHRPMNSLHLLM